MVIGQRHKKAIIIFLIVFSCGSTLFFHVVLKMGIVVTHIYYVPIILASLWLKKSFLIPVFLSLFLTGSHILLRSDVEFQNDLLRAGMFVAVYAIILKIKEKVESSEKELRFAESKLNQVFSLSKDALLMLNREMSIIKINASAQELLGLAEKEVIGRQCSEVFDNSSVCGSERCPVRRILAGATYVELETKIGNERKKKNIPCKVTVIPYWEADGNRSGVILSFKDLTAHKKYKKRLKQYQKKLQSLSSELILAEEKERRRIAAELHDQIGHNLALAQNKIGMMQSQSAAHIKADQFDDVSELIKGTIHTVRSLTFKLSPPILYEFGLGPALKWLAEKFNREWGISCDFSCSMRPGVVDKEIKILLFKVLHELFVNVIKHAKTKITRLGITQKRKYVYIEFIDNGIGFDASQLEHTIVRKQGFGLFNIRERINYIGGSFRIKSHPDRGTAVFISTPINHRKRG